MGNVVIIYMKLLFLHSHCLSASLNCTCGSLLSSVGLFSCCCFVVICRTKVNELSSEIGRFRTEIETVTQDQSNYVSYEKRYVTLREHFSFVLMIVDFIMIILEMQLVLLKVRLIILLCDRRTKQRFVMSRSFQTKNVYQSTNC